MVNKKILVVGAGIGGLAAAAALGQRGHTVEVIEIKADGRVLGVGINQPGNSLRALDALGVLDEILATGFRFDGNEFRDWHDSPIVYVPSTLGDDRVPANVALTRTALGDILHAAAVRAGARIRYGLTVETLTDTPDGATVGLSDGGVESYDLVVAFDGVNSPMRRRLFGDGFDPVFTGHSVWRLGLPREPGIDHAVLYQGDRRKGGLIPLSQDWMYLLLVTPEPGNPRYSPEDFGTMLTERLAGFDGPLGRIRDSIDGFEGIVYSPLVEVSLPTPWHRGNVVVLGDAVHTATPHLTQGAGMALEDAVVLAQEISADRPLEESLTSLAAKRFPRARLVKDVSRAILDGEMAITADTLPMAADHMREELPGQTAFVEGQLNQSFFAAQQLPTA